MNNQYMKVARESAQYAVEHHEVLDWDIAKKYYKMALGIATIDDYQHIYDETGMHFYGVDFGHEGY